MMDKSQALEKTFFWVLLSTLLLGFFWLLSPFFSSLLFSLVLALAFEPFYTFLFKIFKSKRHLAASTCLLLIFLLLAIPLSGLIAAISNQLLKTAQTFQWDPAALQNLLGQGLIAQTLEQWRQALDIDINLGEWLKEFLHNSAQTLYQFSPKVVSRTAAFFLKSLLTLIVTYFLLIDGSKLYREILDLSPLKEADKKTLAKEIKLMLRACIYGYLMTAVVQGILATIGFWIVGVPIALLLGVATSVMSFIPILGAATVWFPVFLFLLMSGHYGKAIFLLVYKLVVITTIDNVLKPLLIRGKTNIHPILLFLAIFGGLKIWGPIGLLAGPVLVAVLLAVLKIYRQDFR